MTEQAKAPIPPKVYLEYMLVQRMRRASALKAEMVQLDQEVTGILAKLNEIDTQANEAQEPPKEEAPKAKPRKRKAPIASTEHVMD